MSTNNYTICEINRENKFSLKKHVILIIKEDDLWCGREDSNFHGLNTHSDLNAARLPIPPRPHNVILVFTYVGNSKLFNIKQGYASIFTPNYQFLW